MLVNSGPIEDGHWIQAGELRSGDLLLSVDESWVKVIDVRISRENQRGSNLDKVPIIENHVND